jgi:hypothetical protein
MSRRDPQRRKRRTTITVPSRVGPHVKLVFTEMGRLNVTYDEMEEGSGVRRAALKAWRHKNYPALQSIEAALGFLGYDFIPVPRAKSLPPEVVEALKPAVETLGLSMPETIKALVEIVAGIHERFGRAEQLKVVEFKPKRRVSTKFNDHPDQCVLLEFPNAA